MRLSLNSFLSFILFFACETSFAGCIPFHEAPQHIGEVRCINAKIMNVEDAGAGLVRLSFCEQSASCPLTALVSADDAEKAGGEEKLRGRTIKIKGTLNAFNGNAEMRLRDAGPLFDDDTDIRDLLKGYDVEQRGRYGAGTSHAPKTYPTYKTKQTATMPAQIPQDTDNVPGQQ